MAASLDVSMRNVVGSVPLAIPAAARDARLNDMTAFAQVPLTSSTLDADLMVPMEWLL